MLKVAKIIKERLDKLNMLEKLTQSHPDYGIMLTGMLQIQFPQMYKLLLF